MFLKNIANIEKTFHFFRWMETFHCFYQLSDHKVALCFITQSVKGPPLQTLKDHHYKHLLQINPQC